MQDIIIVVTAKVTVWHPRSGLHESAADLHVNLTELCKPDGKKIVTREVEEEDTKLWMFARNMGARPGPYASAEAVSAAIAAGVVAGDRPRNVFCRQDITIDHPVNGEITVSHGFDIDDAELYNTPGGEAIFENLIKKCSLNVWMDALQTLVIYVAKH